MEWITHGDVNTRFFFAKAKQRKLSTYIYNINDDQGNQVEGFEKAGNIMMQFYKKLMGKQPALRSSLSKEVIAQGQVLSAEQQVQMCQKFTDKDIRDAIFSIPNTKSPGPDGFSSGFFKTTWSKIGPMICSAIQSFFLIGSLPRFISEAKLIILPKVDHPQSATEFRPISYCNVLYKCISKLLCQRIKTVLSHIIHQSQGAFVRGRELLYNVLICHDIVRGYQRKHISPRYILKMDLQKAFDSNHWEFVKEMLEFLKFLAVDLESTQPQEGG
ncbi:hypothetical protein Cgig2_022103 [Carnegiea gigantea]|uniref:Reverse transcriptase domain-containing protein n=1 Tax=Carnegiea gigantea TaxID=171969 RepID=A0A9Q1GHC3_9CARY|nr:hypothetical protein Cgig2_022103 [Carnegiea gigantea]